MKKLPEFDELVKMSKEELEILREEYIEEIINSASSEDQKRKLRGLQFKIDMERRKAKNPMAACVKISQMMHESFVELRNKLKELTDSNIPIKDGKITEVPALEPEKKESIINNNIVKINKNFKDTDSD